MKVSKLNVKHAIRSEFFIRYLILQQYILNEEVPLELHVMYGIMVQKCEGRRGRNQAKGMVKLTSKRLFFIIKVRLVLHSWWTTR